LSAVADAQKKTCRANLQTIANAVQAARVKGNSADYSTFVGAVSTTLEQDLSAVPTCPLGGAYTVANGNSGNATTFKVACSAVGHGTFQPGLDSN
jgi:type IV pilus assembly protein PilA